MIKKMHLEKKYVLKVYILPLFLIAKTLSRTKHSFEDKNPF